MGKLAARILGVLCVGVGVGLLAWGISSAVMHEPISAQVASLPIFVSSSAVIGWGAGVLALGLTTLILTFKDRPYDPWDK
jgi:hypothetical protein